MPSTASQAAGAARAKARSTDRRKRAAVRLMLSEIGRRGDGPLVDAIVSSMTEPTLRGVMARMEFTADEIDAVTRGRDGVGAR